MGWIFFLAGAVVVLVIAFVAIGRVVARLEVERAPAVYDLSDAVEWIGERLPEEVTARVSFAEVGTVLGWHLDWFQQIGVSSRYGQELAGDDVRTEGAVAPEEEAIDAVVARSLSSGGPDAVDVVCILDLQMRYLAAIGALGDQADS